jgi:glycosyltransferase involved in cell wall biosynthesis
MTDVLIVSLGSTAGLRASDAALAASLRAAGASVEIAAAAPQRQVRTLALTDFVWAHAARAAARAGIARHGPRAVVYSTTTAALLWPAPGAIRYDALAASNRPGRHGVWQRPLEARRVAQAPLLVPTAAAALPDPAPAARAVVVPIAVAPSGAPAAQPDIAAVAYTPDPRKKGLDRILDAWARAHAAGEELVVCGLDPGHAAARAVSGVRYAGSLAPGDYRALLRRAQAFVAAPVYEDYGIAQLEALADGCALVTTPADGPYVALALARELDPRLVGDDLAGALRTALDDPAPGYRERALAALAPFRPDAVDAVVAAELLPALLG